MRKFHNPYFFLPVTSGRPDNECVPFDDIAAGKTDNIRHDCYHPDFHSGKISCTLETVTPTFVGNRHIGGIKSIRSGRYEHYKINGQLAFPANSLNGMIGSIMEALSRSALRVLDRTPYNEKKKKSRYEDAYDAFSVLPDNKNLLPWSSDRTHLTPAERILGVAAEETEGTKENKVSMLKGRIRFTDATSGQRDTERLPAQTLKILASPKPPNQYFYFHKAKNGDQDILLPNGRKYYLHQQKETIESRTPTKKLRWWETRDPGHTKTIHQKIICRPVDEKQKFHFDIHFNNLSDAELGLLLTALNPGKEFVHRLGLGKPFGLGSVRVSITKLDFFDTKESYKGWSDTATHQGQNNSIETFKKSAQDDGWIDTCVQSVLKELGDPDKVTARVTYPVLYKQYKEANKPGGEKDLFKWFGVNKKKGVDAQWLMKKQLKDDCDSFSIDSTLLETPAFKKKPANQNGNQPTNSGGQKQRKPHRKHPRKPQK